MQHGAPHNRLFKERTYKHLTSRPSGRRPHEFKRAIQREIKRVTHANNINQANRAQPQQTALVTQDSDFCPAQFEPRGSIY